MDNICIRSALYLTHDLRTVHQWHSKHSLLVTEDKIYDGSSGAVIDHQWDFSLREGDLREFGGAMWGVQCFL